MDCPTTSLACVRMASPAVPRVWSVVDLSLQSVQRLKLLAQVVIAMRCCASALGRFSWARMVWSCIHERAFSESAKSAARLSTRKRSTSYVRVIPIAVTRVPTEVFTTHHRVFQLLRHVRLGEMRRAEAISNCRRAFDEVGALGHRTATALGLSSDAIATHAQRVPRASDQSASPCAHRSCVDGSTINGPGRAGPLPVQPCWRSIVTAFHCLT